MKRLFTPVIQISIGLLSLTLSLILIAYSFGLVPNEEKAALESRARISESLALQLANLASRNDEASIRDTIASVLGRGSDLLSIGLRDAGGRILAGSANHAALWIEPADGKSTPTHVQVALMDGDVRHGKIELVFRPLAKDTTFIGIPQTLLVFLGFVGVAGFAGYYFILRRALHELDPANAIPERVKAAFDSLAEGVLILDERETVLLANDAFDKKISPSADTVYGTRVSELPWMRSGGPLRAADLPWRVALRDQAPVLGVAMGIRGRSQTMQRLIVNATPVLDGKGTARGVMVTFNDVTALYRSNEQLNATVEELQRSQALISDQNRKLQILASCDPLTGCLNRRAFFAGVESALLDSSQQRQPMSFLMLDVDHFKKINDRFGHAVGDKVLVGLVDLLRSTCRANDMVGRYGGEEFCIAVIGLGPDDAEMLAEHIRRRVAQTATWLPNGEAVTISIGIASIEAGASRIEDFVKRADEALYSAKRTGRNRVVSWERMSEPASAITPVLRRSTTDGNRASEILPAIDSGSIVPSLASILRSAVSERR